MASTDGDSVYLGEPVLMSYYDESTDFLWAPPPSDSLRAIRMRGPGDRRFTLETSLYYYYRAIRRIGVLFRPVADLAADTSRTTTALLDEYFQSDKVTRPATPGWYDAIRIPDTGSAYYLALWVSVGGPPDDTRAPKIRDSSTFLGAVIVDRLHNRIVWSRGGHHAK